MKSEKTLKKEKLASASSQLTQLTPFLFVCGEEMASSLPTLSSNGITHILNASGINLQNHFPEKFTYETYFMYDHKSQDISWFLLKAINFIENARQCDGRVAVHCTQGVSRSCSICIAYFMIIQKMKYNDAFAFVKSIRTVASPNTGFLCNLLELDKFLTHRRSTNNQTNANILFAMLPHATHDKQTWLPKSAMNGENRHLLPPTTKLLNHATTYVVFSDDKIYIWIGSDSSNEATEAAREFAESSYRYYFRTDETPQSQIVIDDAPMSMLITLIGDAEPTAIPSYDESFALIELTEANSNNEEIMSQSEDPNDLEISQTSTVALRNTGAGEDLSALSSAPKLCLPIKLGGIAKLDSEIVTTNTNTNTHTNEYESGPKLYQLNNDNTQWEDMGLYDNEDLYTDNVLVLTHADHKAKSVWFGKKFATRHAVENKEDATAFLAKLSLPVGANLVQEIEFQEDESDLFWERFEEGY